MRSRTRGKSSERSIDRRPLAQRNPNLDWRTRWFSSSRTSDQALLQKAQNAAWLHKRGLIEEKGRSSGALAGYDPAGAGSPWYSIGPRNVNGRVKALAVDPTNPDIVYAGAASGGVWKSNDGGQTWDALWDTQESLAIGAIGTAPGTPSTIYVGSGEWTPGFGASYPGAGVYVSTDAGTTWSVRPGCSCRRIGALVVDPADSSRLWICGDAGLERSEDGGLNWTLLRADTVTDIVFEPGSTSTIYIAVLGTGYFKSTDYGTSFNPLPGAPTGAGVAFPKMAIGVSGAHGTGFLVIRSAGVIQTSTDGGASFTVIAGTHGTGYNGWCDVVACAPDDENIIFSGGVGLDRTADGGASWSGLPVHADQHAVVFAPSNPNIVYFANDGGVYRSGDKGATLAKVSNGLVITQFYNIGFWRTLSNVVGGGAQDNATNYTTSGLTWLPVWKNDGGWFVIDPTDPRVMYAEGQNAYLAKSTDGGASWTSVTSGISGTTNWEGILTMDPNDHLRLYYGTNRVLRTLDGCATAWTAVSQTLSGEVSAIAVAPSDSNRVYAATTVGSVYRTDDGGTTTTWTDKTGTLPGKPISSIWVDPASADQLLVSVGGLLSTGFPGGGGGASPQSVFQSTDGGTTWSDVSGDLPVISANAVLADPSSASMFYVATDGGVYRTTDGGAHWLPFDNGIPNVPVADLAVDPALNMLYAATFGRGAYKLDITPGITKPIVDVYLRDDDLDTGERLPSPDNLPDPLVPAPARAVWWTSPDIKVNHAPYFVPTGVFDGVVFDTLLVHQDPFRGATDRFYVQVSNRGWQPTGNVSVRAFVADASLGLPPLPNALVAPAFDLSSTAAWAPVGPAQTIATLVPNRPVVISWDFALPTGTATHTCCLAVVSSPDDPFSNLATDIATLVTGDKRVCLKNLHVVDPGPAPLGMTLVGIDLFNGHSEAAWADIVVRPSQFGGGTVGLLLPAARFMDRAAALDGFQAVLLAPGDPVGNWYRPRHHEGESRGLLTRWEGLDRNVLWQASPTAVSALRGIRLAAGRALKGVLALSLQGDRPDLAPRVTLEQWINGKLAGGSTFQVGYDLPVDAIAAGRSRRIRVTGEGLAWADGPQGRHRAGVLWLRLTVADDPGRAYLRHLGNPAQLRRSETLFDGLVLDGESLTVELIELARTGDPNRGERLYSRRLDGGVSRWLGHHTIRGGRNQIHGAYRIEEVAAATAPELD
jgi:photosystem II stability/assembly factor-like uncharacterized protein